jgi:hypothetical protein
MSFIFPLSAGEPASSPCGHCGKPRMVTSIVRLRAVLRESPSPLLARLVSELFAYYGALVPLYVCAGCRCVTADSSGHTH